MNNFVFCLVFSLVRATEVVDVNRFPSVDDGDGMFTSSADLVGLLYTEAELVSKLENYVQDEYRRIRKLEEMLADYKSFRDRASESTEKFVGNPLNSFLLIKKLTSDWKEMKDLIQGHGERFLTNITLEREYRGLRWPKDEDLNGAAVGGFINLYITVREIFNHF